MTRLVLVAALLAMVPLAVPVTRAQDLSGSITVQGFTCPRGMTAETLDPGQCEPSDLASMTVQYADPERVTLALRDAEHDGSAYTWSGLPLPAEGETEFHLVVRDAPLGAFRSQFVGDDITDGNGVATVFLSAAKPSTSVRLYYLFPQVPLQSATVAPLACPTTDADIGTCEPLAGVEVAVEADGQPIDGSPFTTRYVPDIGFAIADFIVPLDATLTLTEIDGLPAGYVPAPGYNPMTIAVKDLVRGSGGGGDQAGYYAYHINVPSEQAETVDPTPIDATATPEEGREAHVHRGTCDRLRKDPHWDLTDLTAPTGEHKGSRRAVAAEMSSTVINVSLDELLTTSHVVHVHMNAPDASNDIVCGEIGGVRREDGSVAIGLREVNGSGFEGIAYLVPNTNDPNKTDVWVFVAPKLAQEDQPTPDTSPVPATPQASPEAE